MSHPDRDAEPAHPETAQADMEPARREELEDEEKILAGRVDVNMPALLTRDVQGG